MFFQLLPPAATAARSGRRGPSDRAVPLTIPLGRRNRSRSHLPYPIALAPASWRLAGGSRGRSLAAGLGVLLMLVTAAPSIRAADYHVPSGATPTLQDAVDDAVASNDPLETIYIDADLDVFAETLIPFGFDAAHKLLIRPGTTRLRSTIRMLSCCDPVIHAVGTSHVTIQDLDVFRHITNNDHIILYNLCSDMLIQRCRVGSDWPVSGAPNWSAIYWVYPTDSVIRNTMTFATSPTTWRYGIQIVSHDDLASILRLYNNSVQGFYEGGISLQGSGGEVILRNNLAVTEQATNPDPVGYVGNIAAGLTLLSSFNAAYCDAGDEWSGPDDIRGAVFVRLGFPDLPPSFVSYSWTFDDPNPDFLNLTAAGPLHMPARYGVNLPGGSPDPDDQPVVDDWERDARPGGAPLHTDRGADQADADLAAMDVPIPGLQSASFQITARPIPARRGVEIVLRAGDTSGLAKVYLLDSAGRMIREIWSGNLLEEQTIRWDGSSLPAGMYYLKATLGGRTEIRKVVWLR